MRRPHANCRFLSVWHRFTNRQAVGGSQAMLLISSFPASESCARFSHFLLVWIIQLEGRCRLSQSLRETDSNPAEHGLARWAKNFCLNNWVQCFTSIFISDVGLAKPRKTSFIRFSPLNQPSKLTHLFFTLRHFNMASSLPNQDSLILVLLSYQSSSQYQPVCYSSFMWGRQTQKVFINL